MSITKSKVKIQTSNLDNAGMGLFAKAMFHKGEIVCEYAGEIKYKTQMGKLYESDYDEYLKIHKFVRALDRDRVVVGDPKLINDDWMKSGVYVNDGACLDTSIKYDLDPNCKLIARYHELSMQRQNVEAYVNEDKIYYVATKRIKKGDEIYTHYGKHYWLLLSGIPAHELNKFS